MCEHLRITIAAVHYGEKVANNVHVPFMLVRLRVNFGRFHCWRRTIAGPEKAILFGSLRRSARLPYIVVQRHHIQLVKRAIHLLAIGHHIHVQLVRVQLQALRVRRCGVDHRFAVLVDEVERLLGLIAVRCGVHFGLAVIQLPIFDRFDVRFVAVRVDDVTLVLAVDGRVDQSLCLGGDQHSGRFVDRHRCVAHFIAGVGVLEHGRRNRIGARRVDDLGGAVRLRVVDVGVEEFLCGFGRSIVIVRRRGVLWRQVWVIGRRLLLTSMLSKVSHRRK